jgi:DNA replication ATP-dependent helicase Dna2
LFELSKGAISKYIRGECRRRLRLDLFGTDTARHAAGAPEKFTGRPGLNLVAEQGRIYEAECFASMSAIFGKDRLMHGEIKHHERGQEQAFETVPLERAMTHLATPGHFGMELQYVVTPAFIDAHALHELADANRSGTRSPFSALRPDILQSKGPDGKSRRVIDPAGNIVDLPADDVRIGLRIVDIKLPVEPSPAHFAELAYYGMTLAGWLLDMGYADRFVVLADAAIWPGSQDGSRIRALEAAERARGQLFRDLDLYYQEFERDLEVMPAEVVLGRVIRFLSHDLREVLAPQDWKSLPLHIDGRCIGCDYLGFEWGTPQIRKPDHDLYCAPTAEREDHLSRIAGLTQGACGKLGEEGHDTIARLASLKAEDKIFDQHQNLRATRHIVHARAESLRSRVAARLPERTGTSAVMPRSNDIRVALSADFDVGSGITFALGYQLEAFVPKGLKTDPVTGERLLTSWGEVRVETEIVRRNQAILVPHKNHDSEGREFVDYLKRLRDDIIEVRNLIVEKRTEFGITAKSTPTIQFYLWDMLNFDQFCRMMGRHIVAIRNLPVDKKSKVPGLSPMAWIFPPDEVVQEADNIDRNSSITIVGEMVRLLAADIPYHYSQTMIANAYRRPSRDDQKPFDFSLHPFFADPLSDQIPSERGHEIWRRKSPFPKTSPDQFQEDLRRVVRTRLSATLSVVDRLRSDLNANDSTKLSSEAPTVDSVFDKPDSLAAVSQDSQVIYQHARLMEAAKKLEVDLLMAMPPFEREARFDSIRLISQLKGADRNSELKRLELAGAIPDRNILVFRISPRSTEAKIKAGDFNLSLMPENRLDWQHWTLGRLRREVPAMQAHIEDKDTRKRVRQASKIKMVRFDRAQRIVVVELESEYGWLPQLEATGAYDLDFEVNSESRHYGIIDPLHQDYFVGLRLEPALTAIGVPQVSFDDPLIDAFRVIRTGPRGPRLKETGNPAVDFIWRADELARPQLRDLAAARATIPQQTNSSQIKAIISALTRRLSLLWGPPGTGKSETAASLLVALIAQCKAEGRSVRIAITGPTWVAVDNVMKKLPARLLGEDVFFARLLSSESSDAAVEPALRPHLTPTKSTNARCNELLDRLSAGGVTIVGSTAQQLGKLAALRTGELEQLFDFMLVDEASQMDVAHAIVGFVTLAPGASVTIVGDNLQMAPIHPIDPPLGSEHIVGSIYDFYRNYRFTQTPEGTHSRRIDATMLDTSYRSNQEIVDFVATTGYETLRSANPTLRMRLLSPIPLDRPIDLPWGMPWSADIAKILDPDEPLAAVIHSDPYSSQRNESEAKLVATMVATLSGRLLDEDGELLHGAHLFKKGIGIVTPHRAQQSAVIEFLIEALQPDSATLDEMIRSVDTVERFQGQEKLVMLASFGLGDGDQIASEEEFLYDLNRFNVIVSRAKTKIVVVMSRRLVDYLPHDLKALRDSRLLKDFAGGYLRRSTPLSFPDLKNLGACELRTR